MSSLKAIMATLNVQFKHASHYSSQPARRSAIIDYVKKHTATGIQNRTLKPWIKHVEIKSTIHKGSWPNMPTPDMNNHLTVLFSDKGHNKHYTDHIPVTDPL
ncbi:hypothetical protein K474DRAFT_1710852 [Panus rudis PR-1116 ss-1]|nr:hypothetical protein K474DRAFT_1710852 [Panus rudis PR-1116 ss-1]